jgi:hypothetical protein
MGQLCSQCGDSKSGSAVSVLVLWERMFEGSKQTVSFTSGCVTWKGGGAEGGEGGKKRICSIWKVGLQIRTLVVSYRCCLCQIRGLVVAESVQTQCVTITILLLPCTCPKEQGCFG